MSKELIDSSIMRVLGKSHSSFWPQLLVAATAHFNFEIDPVLITLAPPRMNRRKADFKFAYKFLEDDL